MDKRTIPEWVALTKESKSGWAQFYKELLGSSISDIPRFMKAVADFGHQVMFESVVAASTRKLTGDPLNYVIGIALAKTNERVSELSEDTAYQLRLNKALQRTATQNEDLEKRLEKARNAKGIE